MSLTDLIDVALISTRLQSPAVGMTAREAMSTYGLHRSGHQLLQPAADAHHCTGGQRAADHRQRTRGGQPCQGLQNTGYHAAHDDYHHPAGRRGLHHARRTDPAHAVLAGHGAWRCAHGSARFCCTGGGTCGVTNSTLQAFGRIDLPLVSMFAARLSKCSATIFSSAIRR